MTMNITTITLTKKTHSDGSISPFLPPLLRAAQKAASLQEGRTAACRMLPRYTVRVDGERHEFKRIDTLERFLENIAIGATCEVYRNKGLGATINFDL
jgi:hypothetical protein